PCVFDKQSPGPFHCGPPYRGRPFSRSYRSILPSSLAMNLSSALEFSSQPPVSVYGTGCIARFSWKSVRWVITAAEALVYYPTLWGGSTHNSVCAHQLFASVTFIAMQVREYYPVVHPIPLSGAR